MIPVRIFRAVHKTEKTKKQVKVLPLPEKSTTVVNRHIRLLCKEWAKEMEPDQRRVFKRNLWAAPKGAIVLNIFEDDTDGRPRDMAMMATPRFVEWIESVSPDENKDLMEDRVDKLKPDILALDRISSNGDYLLAGIIYAVRSDRKSNRLIIPSMCYDHLPGFSRITDSSHLVGGRRWSEVRENDATHRVIVATGDLWRIEYKFLGQAEYAHMITMDEFGIDHDWLHDVDDILWGFEPEPLTMEEYIELLPYLEGNTAVWVEET